MKSATANASRLRIEKLALRPEKFLHESFFKPLTTAIFSKIIGPKIL